MLEGHALIKLYNVYPQKEGHPHIYSGAEVTVKDLHQNIKMLKMYIAYYHAYAGRGTHYCNTETLHKL